MSVNNVVILKVKEDKQKSFTSIMQESKVKLLASDGCLSVKMYIDEKDPNTFILVEEWESKEKHNTYFGGLIETGQWKLMSEHLACEPESRYCSEL